MKIIKIRTFQVLSTLFIFFNLSFFNGPGFSQTNSKALRHLEDLRTPTLHISNHFLGYTKEVFMHGITKRAIHMKESLENEIHKSREVVLNVPVFNGQEELIKQYLSYYSSLESHLASLPKVEIEWVEYFDLDSALKFQKIQVAQLHQVLIEADKLKLAVQKFCLVNKVVGSKSTGGLYAGQKEAINLISYAVEVENTLVDLRRLNRLFFKCLSEDTGQNAERVRLEILSESLLSQARLVAIPKFPGDHLVKKTALNNIRQTRTLASGKYIELVKFREIELKMKQKMAEAEQVKATEAQELERQTKEFGRFANLQKHHQADLKVMNQQMINMEKTFNNHFLEFVNDQLAIDPIGKDKIAFERQGL